MAKSLLSQLGDIHRFWGESGDISGGCSPTQEPVRPCGDSAQQVCSGTSLRAGEVTHKATQASCPEGWAGTPKEQHPGSTEEPSTCHQSNPSRVPGTKKTPDEQGGLRGYQVRAACPGKPGTQQPCTLLRAYGTSVPVRGTFEAAGCGRNLRGRGQRGRRCPQGRALAPRASRASSTLRQLRKALGKGSAGLFKGEETSGASGRGHLDKPPTTPSAGPKQA